MGLAVRLVIAVALGLLCAGVILFAPDDFMDSRYNLGVARRSALPTAQYLLETSLTHLHFEPYPNPRPEDWHRGLSVLVAAFWARVAGASESLMRLPHLVYAGAWLLLVVSFASRLNGQPRRRQWGVVGVVLALLLLYEPIWGVMTRAFLDDLPAAALTLGAIAVLLEGRTYRHVAAVGVLLGLASFTKDFYLLWGPLGVVMLMALVIENGERLWSRSTALKVALYCAAFGAVLIPRLLWSSLDLGSPLANPIQHWIVALNFGNGEVRLEYPYFLFNDERYLSRLAMAGSTEQLLSNWATRPVRGVTFAVLALGVFWIPLLLARVINRRVRLSPLARQMALILLLSAGAYMGFLAAGFGEALQLRYWLVPVTLTLLLLCHELRLLAERIALMPLHRVALSAVILIALLPPFLAARVIYAVPSSGTLFTPRAQYPAPMMAWVHKAVLPGQAVSGQVTEAAVYWSQYPQDHVVSFGPALWEHLSVDDLRRFLSVRRVRFAFFAERWSFDGLRAAGLVEVAREDGYVLFEVPEQ